MASDISWHDFVRKFGAYGVSITKRKRSPHYKMTKMIDGKLYIYPVPKKAGQHVKEIYVRKARKRFRLTPGDGVSDDDFNSQ